MFHLKLSKHSSFKITKNMDFKKINYIAGTSNYFFKKILQKDAEKDGSLVQNK